MPPNFGLLPELPERIRDKRRRYGAYRDRALAAISELGGQLPIQPPKPLLALA
jgi:methylenetetrahydrofolate--tRNA-(uracil-5-)-methyltransferase